VRLRSTWPERSLSTRSERGDVSRAASRRSVHSFSPSGWCSRRAGRRPRVYRRASVLRGSHYRHRPLRSRAAL
jgi:hypothetical protein